MEHGQSQKGSSRICMYTCGLLPASVRLYRVTCGLQLLVSFLFVAIRLTFTIICAANYSLLCLALNQTDKPNRVTASDFFNVRRCEWHACVRGNAAPCSSLKGSWYPPNPRRFLIQSESPKIPHRCPHHRRKKKSNNILLILRSKDDLPQTRPHTKTRS